MIKGVSTGSADLDQAVDQILDLINPSDDRDLLEAIFVEIVRLSEFDAHRLDLKIVRAALHEMREAFEAFAPVRHRRKVTIFGSARTKANDPLYAQAKDVACKLAHREWMVVTGAGPGIMEAGMEGAGRENSFGVSIRLPFESAANEVIAGDPKLVSMKYFFTRKLMLMKESSAFIAMPGGFGTLDETMELITLQQTGKAAPAPLVLLDVPGGSYWTQWRKFIEGAVRNDGYVGPHDLTMVHLCDHVDSAVAYIERFYANYRSIRWFGSELVLRLHRLPDAAGFAELNSQFAALTTDGKGLAALKISRAEREDADELDAERVGLRLNPVRMAGLHQLIDALNNY